MMKSQTADEVSKLEYACTHIHTIAQGEESVLKNSYICIISLI